MLVCVELRLWKGMNGKCSWCLWLKRKAEMIRALGDAKEEVVLKGEN